MDVICPACGQGSLAGCYCTPEARTRASIRDDELAHIKAKVARQNAKEAQANHQFNIGDNFA